MVECLNLILRVILLIIFCFLSFLVLILFDLYDGNVDINLVIECFWVFGVVVVVGGVGDLNVVFSKVFFEYGF